MPAFIDAHQHAYLVAVDPFTDFLHRRAADVEALLSLVAPLVAATPRPTLGQWLRFHGGYQPLDLAERSHPMRPSSTG